MYILALIMTDGVELIYGILIFSEIDSLFIFMVCFSLYVYA